MALDDLWPITTKDQKILIKGYDGTIDAMFSEVRLEFNVDGTIKVFHNDEQVDVIPFSELRD